MDLSFCRFYVEVPLEILGRIFIDPLVFWFLLEVCYCSIPDLDNLTRIRLLLFVPLFVFIKFSLVSDISLAVTKEAFAVWCVPEDFV